MAQADGRTTIDLQDLFQVSLVFEHLLTNLSVKERLLLVACLFESVWIEHICVEIKSNFLKKLSVDSEQILAVDELIVKQCLNCFSYNSLQRLLIK